MTDITLNRGERKHVVIDNPPAGRLTINLAEGSALALDIIEDAPSDSVELEISAALNSDAALDLTFATLNGRRLHTTVNVDLNGTGASASVNGFVLANSDQQITYTTNIAHHAEHSTSNQLFKYVADGQSQCAFNGRIIVDQAARFTEAYQTNRNLLASRGARMHAEPTLEIYCDEVKCSHGAATGQLDENALFYMRQRGIPLETARRMLMQAFVSEVAARIADEKVRENVLERIESRFSDF